MDKICIGKKIKKLRGKRSIKEFAKLCKISSKTLANIESDMVEPRLDTVLKIAEGLKIEPWQLLKILKQ